MAKHIPARLPVPVLDGDPHDPVWSSASAVTVRTVKGLHNPQDYVDITLKALHDGQHIYFRLQWSDPDVSTKSWPLRKTAHGWEVLQTALEQHNETVYAEDKLAMYITDVPNGGCAATYHLAARQLAALQGPAKAATAKPR